VLAQERSSRLLIDGIRHAHIVAELARQLKPTRLFLVFLDAPRALLLQRLGASGLDTAAAEALLSNATEIEVEATLRSRADIVIDATQSARDNANILTTTLLRATIESDTRTGTRPRH
jgi:hypothetical protein